MKVIGLNNGIQTLENVPGDVLTESVNTSLGNNVIVPAPTTDIIKFTNPSLLSIREILTSATRNSVFLVNETGVTISIEPNYNSNGIIMGTSTSIQMPNKSSVRLVYSSTLSRWVVVGIIGTFVDSISNQTISGIKTFDQMLEVTGGSDFLYPPLFRAGIDLYTPVGGGLTSIIPSDSTASQIYWILPATQGGVNTFLKNDGSGNLSWAAGAGGGGGGSVDKQTIDVDFGTGSDYVQQTVSASWVTPTHNLSFTIMPNTLDHDTEDVLLEELKCTYGNVVNGVSFDLHVHAPNDTWGRYKIQVIGV